MGCDIHCFRERLTGGRWLSSDKWTEDYSKPGTVRLHSEDTAYSGRNYDLFGLLAGVRREFAFSMKPRGLPLDVSLLVAKEAKDWDTDGHSHSFMLLGELVSLRKFCDDNTIPVSGMKDAEELAALMASIEAGKPNWELLFPFCQSTNDRCAVEFHLDVPMAFKVGGCLDKIIASFDGIEGDNHRLVFWFDN